MYSQCCVTITTKPSLLNWNFFLIPQNTLYQLNNNFLSLQPLVTFSLSSVSMNLSILDDSCKCNHTIFVLLCLIYFTEPSVLKVHPCCSIYQNFSSFYSWVVFQHSTFLLITWMKYWWLALQIHTWFEVGSDKLYS